MQQEPEKQRRQFDAAELFSFIVEVENMPQIMSDKLNQMSKDHPEKASKIVSSYIKRPVNSLDQPYQKHIPHMQNKERGEKPGLNRGGFFNNSKSMRDRFDQFEAPKKVEQPDNFIKIPKNMSIKEQMEYLMKLQEQRSMNNIEENVLELNSVEEMKNLMAEQASSITMQEVQELMVKGKKEDDPAIVDLKESEKDTPKNQKVEVQKEVKQEVKNQGEKQEIPVKQKNGQQEQQAQSPEKSNGVVENQEDKAELPTETTQNKKKKKKKNKNKKLEEEEKIEEDAVVEEPVHIFKPAIKKKTINKLPFKQNIVAEQVEKQVETQKTQILVHKIEDFVQKAEQPPKQEVEIQAPVKTIKEEPTKPHQTWAEKQKQEAVVDIEQEVKPEEIKKSKKSKKKQQQQLLHLEELKKEREQQEEKEKRENEVKNKMLLEELQRKPKMTQPSVADEAQQQFSLDDIIEQQKAASNSEKAIKQKEMRSKQKNDKQHDIREVFKMADHKTEIQNEQKRKGQMVTSSVQEHDIVGNRKRLQQNAPPVDEPKIDPYGMVIKSKAQAFEEQKARDRKAQEEEKQNVAESVTEEQKNEESQKGKRQRPKKPKKQKSAYDSEDDDSDDGQIMLPKSLQKKPPPPQPLSKRQMKREKISSLAAHYDPKTLKQKMKMTMVEID